jgi:hypothetical protein
MQLSAADRSDLSDDSFRLLARQGLSDRDGLADAAQKASPGCSLGFEFDEWIASYKRGSQSAGRTPGATC